MIFKTFNNNIDKWTAKIGIFGKSFNDIFEAKNQKKLDIDDLVTYKGMSLNEAKKQVGNFWSYLYPKKEDIENQLIDVMPEINTTNISDATEKIKVMASAVLENKTTWQKLFDTLPEGEKHLAQLGQQMEEQIITEEGVIKANQQARASAIAHNEAIKAQTLSAKAGKAALKGLSIAMNIAANIGLSLLISKIVEAFTANERLLNSAKKLSEEFKQEQVSINGYKDKIDELQKIISDSSSSFDATTQARIDLMKIQDELIKKFGTEKETIETITDAISNQSDALDFLTKKQYQKWKNNFNKKDFGMSVSDFFSSRNIEFAFDKLMAFDFSGSWEALTYPTESNIDKMVSSMQRAYYTLRKTGNDTLDSLIQKTYHLNLGGDGSSFVLSGNLNDVYETLLEIQKLANDYNVSAPFKTSATILANSIDKTLQSYKEAYDIYILYEKILYNSKDNQYDEQFKLINKAKEKFDEASILGDTDKIKEAADEYAQTLQSAIDLALGNWDQGVANYFKSMYPELQQMFGEWKFNLNFEPNTDGLKDKVTNALDAIDGASDGNVSFSVEDIDFFNLNTATQEQIEAYGDLNNVAVSYGLTLKQLLALLQTMELVQSESYQQLVDTFGQENVDKLLPDELKIAYLIENNSNMTFDELQAEIKKTKEIVEAPITFSAQLTNSTDSIDKFQSTVKSAADAYTTLLTGNYSSSELLDSIQAINKAASDMGESIDWESMAASDNPLQAIQEQIEAVSNTYTKSVLSGTGIDTDSKFGQMLANIVQEAYKSEAALSSLNTQIDSLQSAYNDLTDIITTYNETGYITFDQLQTLLAMEPQYLSCLIDENGQLQLNQQSMIALANQRLDDAEAQAIQQAITELGELAYRNEQAAIEDVDTALIDNAETLTTYEEKLLETAGITNLTTNEFIQLSNAINGAMNEGASQEQVDDVIDNMNKKLQLIGNIRNRVNTGDFASAFGSAGKDAAKSFTDALDKELTALDKKMEAGYIDFNDYIQARLKLIEAYYEQGKLSADEYYSYLEKHYDTQLAYMDKVVSAVTRRIDTEIDALKQQKEDAESLYKVQIESLEKQKTLLEEANQERQRQIDLQKSLYDLERARNQRTKLVYSEDKGMHYVADEQSIRDAQKSADDAKYENQIAEIEKSISKLENARDQETSAIDAMISNLEEYKDAWGDVTSAYKEEQEDLLAAQFFGANWESDILNGRLKVLNDFKEQYIRIQQEIAAAAARESVNEQVSGSKDDQKKQNKALDILKTPIQRLSSSLASSLTSSLSAQNQGILSHIQTYGSGTNNAKKGLNLVGEDGAEAYFDNHGHVAIVTKPTLIPMEGGEVVKNERDTKELLDPDNLAPADTIALADIDGKEARYTIKVDVEAETFTLSDGTVLTPLQPEGRMFELQQKFDAYMESIAHNVDMLSADIARDHSRQMQEITNPVTNSSTVNNRNVQPVVNQNITLNCPNVTNNSGIEYIRKELGHLSLRAMQESMK